jgi:transmembrane sensor
MSDRKLYDVPPLSDLSRQRIRQSVFDRLDRETVVVAPATAPRSRRTALFIAVGVAAAAALALFLVRDREGDHPAARAPSPSRITTGESPTQVAVGDARITAGPHAALTVTDSGDAGVQVLIERGAIEFAVAPRGERPPFVVLAADVRVEVVGTVFTVARDGDDVTVAVAKGVVRVTRGGEEARVAAGQAWPVVATEGAAASEEEEEPELTFDPQPAKTARAKRKSHEPAAPAEEAPAAPTARERYDAAVAAEKTRPEEALTTYRALAAEGGAWADNALFAEARLELDLGRKDAARRSLGAYLRRYPRGANAGLARALLDGLK